VREPFVVCGEGRTVIQRSPKDILEFVLDVEQYRRADLKIGQVLLESIFLASRCRGHFAASMHSLPVRTHPGERSSSIAGASFSVGSVAAFLDWCSVGG
jgi:hypothetical protein